MLRKNYKGLISDNLFGQSELDGIYDSLMDEVEKEYPEKKICYICEKEITEIEDSYFREEDKTWCHSSCLIKKFDEYQDKVIFQGDGSEQT